MKNIRELTDAQVTEIAGLALEDIINQDFVFSAMAGKVVSMSDYKILVERELYDKEENLMVVRGYLDGSGKKTYIAIWEDNLNVETYEIDDVPTANQVKIVLKLIEWGFVDTAPSPTAEQKSAEPSE